jgi:hypothetical protein
MGSHEEVHAEFDRHANAGVQVGRLPPGLHVEGRVAWHVYQGSYSKLGEAFRAFIQTVEKTHPGKTRGAPGDVYVCSPERHVGKEERTLTTIFWVPLAE